MRSLKSLIVVAVLLIAVGGVFLASAQIFPCIPNKEEKPPEVPWTNEELTKKVWDLTKQYDDLRVKYDKLKEENEGMKDKIDDLKDKIDDLKDKIDDMKDDYDDLKDKVKKMD